MQDPVYAAQTYPTWSVMDDVPPSWTNVPEQEPSPWRHEQTHRMSPTEAEPWSSDGGVRVGEFGVLDFLQEVVSDFAQLLEVAQSGELHRFPDRKPILRPLTTRERASDDWDARTQVIGTAVNILVPVSSKRRYIELINYGPGTVFISADKGIGSGAAASPGEVRLLVSSLTLWAPRRLTTRAAVNARATEADTILEVVQENDMEESNL